MPVIPATQEAEAGELLELGRQGLQGGEITPLHSSLGDKSKTLFKKTNKQTKNRLLVFFSPESLNFLYILVINLLSDG